MREIFVVGTLFVGVIVFSTLLYMGMVYDRRPPTEAEMSGDLPNGAEILLVERSGDWGATRVLRVAGCLIVQDWASRGHYWYLSESEGHGFGGTENISNLECGAAP